MATTNTLSDAAIRKAKPGDKPRKLSDGGGLYLELQPNGGKWWRLKYRIDGKEKRLGLGTYPEVTLAEARALVAAGTDPLPLASINAPVLLDALRRVEKRGAMCRWLTVWRNDPDTAWLAETPVQVQQQTLKRLGASDRRFFAGQGGYPRFRGRGQAARLRFPKASDCKLDAENQRLKPPKPGWVRIRQSQEVQGEARNYTLTQKRGRGFVSIQVEQPDVIPPAGLVPTLGIDFGGHCSRRQQMASACSH